MSHSTVRRSARRRQSAVLLGVVTALVGAVVAGRRLRRGGRPKSDHGPIGPTGPIGTEGSRAPLTPVDTAARAVPVPRQRGGAPPAAGPTTGDPVLPAGDPTLPPATDPPTGPPLPPTAD